MITKQQLKDRTNKIKFLKRIENKFKGWNIEKINKRLELCPFLLDEFKLIEKTHTEKQPTLKTKILNIIKKEDKFEGIFKDVIIKMLKENHDIYKIQKEIINLLEKGYIYEPIKNKLRWLG